jgi:hypothetical protein
MKISLVCLGQVRILAEGVIEAAPLAADLPPDLSPGLCRRDLRIGRLGRTGPSPWPSCGSHGVPGGGLGGGRRGPLRFS